MSMMGVEDALRSQRAMAGQGRQMYGGPAQAAPGSNMAQEQQLQQVQAQRAAMAGQGRQMYGGPVVSTMPGQAAAPQFDAGGIANGMAARQQQQAQLAAIQRAQQGMSGGGMQGWQQQHPAFQQLKQMWTQRLGGMFPGFGQGVGGGMQILPFQPGGMGQGDPRQQFLAMLQRWMGGGQGGA